MGIGSRLSDAGEQAAMWLARLHADSCSPTDVAAFRVWLAESPLNQSAFEEATALWEAAGDLTDRTYRFTHRPNRRYLVAGTALLAVSIGGFLGWTRRNERVYVTAARERRVIKLEDGSAVTLDGNSELRTRYSAQTRDLHLVGGQAFFNVASDPRRPFVVKASGRDVIAIGTAFDVAVAEEALTVMLVSGAVALQDRHSEEKLFRMMMPGDRAVLRQHGQVIFDRPDVYALSAWREGKAIFSDLALNTAVEQMNHYASKQIIVENSIAPIKISGSYSIDDPEGFARSVALLIGGRVQIESDKIYLSGEPDSKAL